MKKNIEHDNKSCEHARNKNYYENLAKFVLEEFLPKRFYDLKLSDRPDIRQADWIGIEVTRAFWPNQAYAEGISKKIQGKALSDISSKEISKLDSLGYKIIECKGLVAGYFLKEYGVPFSKLFISYLPVLFLRKLCCLEAGRFAQIPLKYDALQRLFKCRIRKVLAGNPL